MATTTIPISLVIFGFGWLVSKNLIGAAVLPAILFVASLYSNIGKYIDDIKRESAGFMKTKFKVTKVFELLAPDDSVEPSLCMEIDDDKYLLTNGQWIYDEDIYGKDAKKYREGDSSNIFNGYLPPYSFPSTEFELWVSHLDGRPAKIVVIGEYLAPKEVSWPTPEKYKNCDHAIIDKKEVNAEKNE